MLPSEHLYDIFYRMSIIYPAIMGVDYLRSTYTPRNPYTLMISISMVFSLACVIYTIATQSHGDALQCVCLMPYGMQGVCKYFFFCSGATQMRCNVEHLMSIYRQCDRTRTEALVLVKWSLRVKRFIRYTVVSICVIFTVFILMVVYLKLATGEWEPLLPVFLIGRFNDHLRGGFMLRIGLHLLMLFLAANGVLAAELIFFMQVLHVCPMTELLQQKLATLGSELRSRPFMSERPEFGNFLDNCIRMHMEYFAYMQRVSEVFYIIVIIEIGINAFSMCMLIYVMMQVVWYPLYGLFFLFFMKTMMACALGTVADYCSDTVWNAFGEFPWHLLQEKDKKKFVMIYQRVQLPTVLMCGTIKLNMELFVSVMRNTFSVAMLLLRMTE